MRSQKCPPELYSKFLEATTNCSATELARSTDGIAHDAVTRWLDREDGKPKDLWREVAPLVERKKGYLVIDDSLILKPYGQKIDLVRQHYSTTEGGVRWGIPIICLLWSDGN